MPGRVNCPAARRPAWRSRIGTGTYRHGRQRYCLSTPMQALPPPLLVPATAPAEIVGCHSFLAVAAPGRSAQLLLPAAASLALFAWLLTLHPAAAGAARRVQWRRLRGRLCGRGIGWLWAVDGIRPGLGLAGRGRHAVRHGHHCLCAARLTAVHA